MPSQVSSFTNPATVASSQGAPNTKPLTSPRALTSDAQGTSNSTSASGADLVTRTINPISTASVNGLGGRVDLIV
ncbi:MAG: hypothetical protein QGG64_16280 [Candidatus Latescibacteria bacterium]|jgi:hypothetical protein|nr:hypothetical protein [Candidatus Latescibacterota bacterium]